MLRLSKLQVSGFKSFSDRTEVTFPEGITGVVGPNGCGKSNIGDAINWVLGEQSAKHLRGRSMMDVIFNGSATRKPQGMAEVTLVFEGAEGLPHADGSRLAITRRLFRSGDSEYLLNGKKVRLKDIQDLLRDSHIGTRTFSKIEQGRIDQVLNAKPRDRRQMIEDAAGISGYKHKRRLTELKLEATTANLLRVNDVIVEVTRQINSLKRQASKARRYKNLREELREQELLRFAVRGAESRVRLARLQAAERRAHDLESEAAATLSTAEVELIDRRNALQQQQARLRETAAELHELDKTIDREEQQLAAHRERIAESEATAGKNDGGLADLRVRAESLAAEVDTHAERAAAAQSELDALRERVAGQEQKVAERETRLREGREELETLRADHFAAAQQLATMNNRRHALDEALDRDHRQRDRLQRESGEVKDDATRLADDSTRLASELEQAESALTATARAFEESESALADARSRQRELTDALADAREQERSSQAKLATLEDVATRFADVSDGVRTVLSDGVAHGVRSRGVVADFIEAGAEFEHVAERYLTGVLPAVVLEDDGDVCRAAELVRERKAGRTCFIAATQPCSSPMVGHHEPPSARIEADSRVRGRLRERLVTRTAANGALEGRLGDAVVVDTLQTALELHRIAPQSDYVSESGDIVYASGLVVVGGDEGGREGLLAHNRRIEEARVDLTRSATSVQELSAARETIEAEVTELDARVAAQRGELESLRARRIELRLQNERSSDERAKIEQRHSVLSDELTQLSETVERLAAERSSLLGEVAGAEERLRELDAKLSERAGALVGEEQAVREESERLSELRTELARHEQRQETLDSDRERSQASLGELHQRVTALESELGEARRRIEESTAEVARLDESLVTLHARRKESDAVIKQLERETAELEQSVGSEEQQLRARRQRLDELRDTTRRAELERARIEADREHLEELCAQELQIGTDQALLIAGDRLEGVDLDALEETVAQVRGKIERLGPVNMTAIEEFSELEERHQFLAGQKDDLEKSMHSLRETIKRINRQSRELFLAAFTEIRASYQEIYKSLFNGGRADLRLEEGEDVDVLECGIEILAQPPGKRLAGVHLLSGGEKALSAIALLFAIFRFQPSPFCMLDEVDAALDDANASRFSKMLREYSANTQFILVTHNKLSMENADLLYGVTMEEPGISRVMSMRLEA